jgi:hypothetical protein
MTAGDYEAEIRLLHGFILQLAGRLAAASEVLSVLAERKQMRPVTTPKQACFACDRHEVTKHGSARQATE